MFTLRKTTIYSPCSNTPACKGIDGPEQDMSYPPNPYDEHGSPLMNGQSSTTQEHEDTLDSDIKDKEEEELNAVRRYEDFTTVGMCCIISPMMMEIDGAQIGYRIACTSAI
jgi:hypothetical protein